MAAAVYDRVPVDEITRRAKHARPGHVLATLAGGIVFYLAWSLVMLGKLLWLPLAFAYMAADEGVRSALGVARPVEDVGAVMAENARLREEVQRLDLAGMLPEVERLRTENEQLRVHLSRFSG